VAPIGRSVPPPVEEDAEDRSRVRVRAVVNVDGRFPHLLTRDAGAQKRKMPRRVRAPLAKVAAVGASASFGARGP
jgi:hypothetical protein